MIDVIKQMVEALEWCHGGEPVGTADAIQAGRQAIAELESQEPDVVMHWHSHTWTTINPPPKNSGDVNLYYAPPQRTEPKVCCQQYDTCLEPCTPRGTHLAQRTWAGLTDDEINASSKGHITRNGFARAIEVKLKEKNCAG